MLRGVTALLKQTQTNLSLSDINFNYSVSSALGETKWKPVTWGADAPECLTAAESRGGKTVGSGFFSLATFSQVSPRSASQAVPLGGEIKCKEHGKRVSYELILRQFINTWQQVKTGNEKRFFSPLWGGRYRNRQQRKWYAPPQQIGLSICYKRFVGN